MSVPARVGEEGGERRTVPDPFPSTFEILHFAKLMKRRGKVGKEGKEGKWGTMLRTLRPFRFELSLVREFFSAASLRADLPPTH